MMASTSDVTPAVERTTPRTSKRCRRTRGSRGIRSWPASRVTATMGRFTRKIEPYQKCSSSAPPTIGPNATAMPDVAPQMPSAFCRSEWSGKTLVRMARLAGKMKAAATPMRARRRDQRAGRVRRRRSRREHAEEDEADLHRALAAEAVADAAAREQQPGEGEAVRVDDPLQRGDRGAEMLVERRERDVDDRVVDHDQEHAEAQDRQDQPAAVAGVRVRLPPVPGRPAVVSRVVPPISAPSERLL